ncbi:MAG: carbon storage regulator [Lysobacter sp.]|nr:carbon storage regulator [Lysobacter sp.]
MTVSDKHDDCVAIGILAPAPTTIRCGGATVLPKILDSGERVYRLTLHSGDDIEIGATRVRVNFKPTRLTALTPRRIPVRIAIDAPAHIAVHREEVYARIQATAGRRAPAPFSRWLREANAAQTDRENLRAAPDASTWRLSAVSRQANAEFVFS